jgi:hypothetical protein
LQFARTYSIEKKRLEGNGGTEELEGISAIREYENAGSMKAREIYSCPGQGTHIGLPILSEPQILRINGFL